MKRTWDRVVAAQPVNRVARRVVRKGVRHDVVPPDSADTDYPLHTRPFDGPPCANIEGKRFGRLTVVALEFWSRESVEGLLWVVRCDCGMYSLRRAAALKCIDKQQCSTCQYVAALRQPHAVEPRPRKLNPELEPKRRPKKPPPAPVSPAVQAPAPIPKAPPLPLSMQERVLSYLCSCKSPRNVQAMAKDLRADKNEVGNAVGQMRQSGWITWRSKTQKTYIVTTRGREALAEMSRKRQRA